MFRGIFQVGDKVFSRMMNWVGLFAVSYFAIRLLGGVHAANTANTTAMIVAYVGVVYFAFRLACTALDLYLRWRDDDWDIEENA